MEEEEGNFLVIVEEEDMRLHHQRMLDRRLEGVIWRTIRTCRPPIHTPVGKDGDIDG